MLDLLESGLFKMRHDSSILVTILFFALLRLSVHIVGITVGLLLALFGGILAHPR